MAITAALVKELREKTSAGMMECKKALVEADGDMEKATQILRESGLAKAAKKADRIAAEGRICVAQNDDATSAAILEVNCETDFVAKGDAFADFSQGIVNIALKDKSTDIEHLLEAKLGDESVEETRRNLVTTLGENINVRRADLIEQSDIVSSYVHGGGRIGVIVSGKCSVDAREKGLAFLKNVAMHISAMNPMTKSYQDLSAEFVESETQAIRATIEKENEELVRLGKAEKRIPDFVSRHQLTDAVLVDVKAKMEDELKAQGKPEAIWDRIIPGQIARYIKDNTQLDQEHALFSQTYVLDDSKTVEQAAAEVDPSFEIVGFTRYELGDGIEKKEDNFVEEVMAQAKG